MIACDCDFDDINQKIELIYNFRFIEPLRPIDRQISLLYTYFNCKSMPNNSDLVICFHLHITHNNIES